MPQPWAGQPLYVCGLLGVTVNEETAARRLAAARARVILAEAGTDPTEFVDALRARDKAEQDYMEAVNA